MTKIIFQKKTTNMEDLYNLTLRHTYKATVIKTICNIGIKTDTKIDGTE